MLMTFECSDVREGQSSHCHDQIELFQLTEGRGELRIGRHRYSTRKSVLAVVGPQELHAGSPVSAAFGVRGFLVSPSHTDALGLNWHKIMAARSGISDSKRLNIAFRIAMNGLNSCSSLMHADELLILLCNGEAGPQGKVSRKEKRIQQAVELLRCSLETDLTLSALATIVGLDPVYLCRAFRLTVGLPPHAYRNRLRVPRATTLIHQGHQAKDAAIQWASSTKVISHAT